MALPRACLPALALLFGVCCAGCARPGDAGAHPPQSGGQGGGQAGAAGQQGPVGAVRPVAGEPAAPDPPSPAAPPPAVPAAGTPTAIAASETAVAPRGRSAAAGADGHTWLTPAAARRLMVDLINRDRASEGLGPVVLDEGPATRAGQAHAEDMARHAYLGHWGTDGSVPEQRFTEAGGADMVLENASCFTDERSRVLDRAPRIDARNVELAEDMFFHEKPPHDGHRRNILKPWHKRVGIGVAQPVVTPTEIPAPCFAQEFVDAYGTYAAIPRAVHPGEVLHVEGTVSTPAVFAGIGMARVDAPKPLSIAELNRRRSYPVPTPYVMYWPPGFQTPVPVRLSGSRFSVDVPATDGAKPGMYELSVWATMPGTPDLVMVSLRTFLASPSTAPRR